MSFGFSIGDFITVLQLANDVRKQFVGAPDQFKDISDEFVAPTMLLAFADCVIGSEASQLFYKMSMSTWLSVSSTMGNGPTSAKLLTVVKPYSRDFKRR